MQCPLAARPPLRGLLFGPQIVIRVSTYEIVEEFTLPKALVCESSTYFESAFNNGFKEAKEGSVTLEGEHIEVFRTYVLWLYTNVILPSGVSAHGHEDFDPIAKRSWYEYEQHLVDLYLFADRRGIPRLQDEVIRALDTASDDHMALDSRIILENYRKIPKHTSLYHFLLENMCFEKDWALEYRKGKPYPKDFCIDVLCAWSDREKAGDDFVPIEDRLCDFHEHSHIEDMPEDNLNEDVPEEVIRQTMMAGVNSDANSQET